MSKHPRRLTLEVVEARNLSSSDARAASDPFCNITITDKDKKRITEKTKVQKKAVDPKWNEKFELTIERSSDLVIQVVDWNMISANEVIGTTAPIKLNDFEGKTGDKWFPITRKKNDKTVSTGELHLRISVAKPPKEKKEKKGAKKVDSKTSTTSTKNFVVAPPATKDIFHFIRENDFNGLCDFLKSPDFKDINKVDSYGYTPLQSACSSREGDERIIMRLLQVPGIDVATPIKSDGNTALHYFCQNYKSPLDVDTLLQMFIKLGADVNYKNQNNETAIFKAIFNNAIRLLLVEKLLECGADVNIYSHSHGEGVLHYAVRLQREDLMSVLLRAGADTKVKGKIDQKTPLELALQHPNEPSLKVLAARLTQVQELEDWLQSNDLSKYRVAFIKKDMTKAHLGEINSELLDQMGVTNSEDRKKIKKACKAFKKPKSGEQTKTVTAPTQAEEDSSKSLQKILAELDSLTLDKKDWVIGHLDLEFTKKLGSGAAGDVFSGLYKGKPVAIKVLKEHMAEKELVEFKKEFQILCSVHSKYTVHFFGACLHPKLCMVMELCHRGSLCDVMKAKDLKIGWKECFQLAIETTLGIDTLHSHNPMIVHRDLKSLNLLVTNDWHVKVCDFGLSRFDTQANDETLHQLRGTMAFCAPEVYHSSKFTPKSDIFSLIIVIWELVVRVVKGKYEAPYSEYKNLQYDFQIIIQVAKKNLRPTIPAAVPEIMANLLKVGMDGDPEKRPTLKEIHDLLFKMQQDYEANPGPWDAAITPSS